jgi:hypothetical protein
MESQGNINVLVHKDIQKWLSMDTVMHKKVSVYRDLKATITQGG